MKYLFLTVLSFVLTTTAGCDKLPEALRADNRRGELTRELATKLLNEHFAKPSVHRLAFKRGGIENAIRDGIVERGSYWSYHFTAKGREMVSSFVRPEGNALKGNSEMKEVRPIEIELNAPIAQRIRQVTGIAASRMPGITEVEFETDYFLAPAMQKLSTYVYSGETSSKAFRKYDDGWRVVDTK